MQLKLNTVTLEAVAWRKEKRQEKSTAIPQHLHSMKLYAMEAHSSKVNFRK